MSNNTSATRTTRGIKMKTIILSLITLLICSALVQAAYSNVASYGDSGQYKVTYQQTIKKGWNLLPADLGSWSIMPGAPELEFKQHVKAYSLYLPLQNRYANALGGFNEQDYNLVQSNQKYLTSAAAWYYITDDTLLSYTVENVGAMPKLHQGWNFLSIGPYLSVLNPKVSALHHFPIGNCNIEKFYSWNPESQRWSEKNMGMAKVNNALDELSDADAIGIGIAIKVKNTCQLGIEEEKSNQPPTFPN